MLRPFCGSAFIALVSNDAGENKNRTSDKMKLTITTKSGKTYSATLVKRGTNWKQVQFENGVKRTFMNFDDSVKITACK